MRRRFTLAIVGIVAGALLVAGVGSLVLLTLQSRRDARRDVNDLARRVAAEVATRGTVGSPSPALRPLQNFLRSTQEFTLVAVRADGVVGALPRGIKAADIDASRLLAGSEVSGIDGHTAFAVAPVGQSRIAAVVTQQTSKPGGAGLYLLLSGGVALLVAFAVAETLSRRITHPLVTVEQAAGRIAQGDLSARAPVPRQSYPELVSLTGSVNGMADSLERLRGQERQFLLSVSHDLRTPLTSIRGFGEALADGTAKDPTSAGGVIAAEARRLERLVRDLLDLAKIDAHQFALDVRPVDLWEVVSDTAHGFAPTAERLGLALAVHDPQGETVPVSADPDRLAQVVANLVENACNYATGRIDIGTWFRSAPSGPEAVITVDDDGPGIAADALPHVFERLWTNRDATGRHVGSGLGLAIVAELVGAMGGQVRAESPIPGGAGGTRMVVSLRPALTASRPG